MINNNNELLEKDDWLAKQRELESRISVWDFDDAKKLAQEHEARHQARKVIDYKAVGNKNIDKGFGIFFALNMILLSFLVLLIAFTDVPFFYVAFSVLCLGIFPGIIIYGSIKRKFPPESYWIFVFVFTMIFVIAGFMLSILRRY